MLILEGPDNSGKTQLALGLHRLFGWPTEHSNRPELIAYEGHDREFMAFMHSVQQLSPKAVIRDRTYIISENVYGPIIRGQSMLGVFQEQSLKYLANTQTPIIYCRPPKSFITRGTKEEMAGVRDNWLTIIERYDKIMEMLEECGAFIYRYNYMEPQAYHKLTKYLLAHIRQYNLNEDKIHEFTRSA